MVEIQSDSYSIGFECLENADEDGGLDDLKQYHKNLVELRDQMLQHQTALRTALSRLQHGINGNHHYAKPTCISHATGTVQTARSLILLISIKQIRKKGS